MDYVGVFVFIASGLAFFFLAILNGVKSLMGGTSNQWSEVLTGIGCIMVSAMFFTFAVALTVIKIEVL